MRHARNDFFRWDAAQTLLATYIKLNVTVISKGSRCLCRCMWLTLSARCCSMRRFDPALAAEILTLRLRQ
ncbi:aminopeptidase N C-terminal domain-containing protein [Shigella sonnei]